MIMNQTKKKNPLKRLLSMRGMGQVVTVTVGRVCTDKSEFLVTDEPDQSAPPDRSDPDYRYCTVLCPYYRQY